MSEIEEIRKKLPEGPTKLDPKGLFSQDRGERAYYVGAATTDSVLLPLTRDGFEALLERAAGQFTPPLPVDNSVRKVFSGWVHHIENNKNATSIEEVGRILYKSIANSLTWTVDQEIKMVEQESLAQARAEAQKKADDERKAAKIAEREIKQATKASRRTTVRSKPDESEAT